MPQIVDTIISLFFVYFVFSNLASMLIEVWNHNRKKRHKDLKYAIEKVFNDITFGFTFADDIYDHPSIKSIKRSEGKLPAYISDEQFSSVLTDIFIALSTSGATNYEKFESGVNTIAASDLKTLLLSFINNITTSDADKKGEQLKFNIKNWYNDYMDRVTGWFKRDLRVQLLIVAIPLTIFFNIDTIKLVDTFYNDDDLRDEMVLAAIKATETIERDSLRVRSFEDASNLNDDYYNGLIKEGFELLDTLKKIPLGWTGEKNIVNQKVRTLMSTCSIGSVSFQADEDSLKLGLKSIDRKLKTCLQSGLCHVEFENDKLKTFFEKEPCDCLTSYYSSKDSMALLKLQLLERKAETTKNRTLKRKQFENQVMAELNFWDLIKENTNALTLLGWIISVIAISRGASFWFDNLIKLVNARSAGIKPKTNKT